MKVESNVSDWVLMGSMCKFMHYRLRIFKYVCVSLTKVVGQLPAADLLSFLAKLQCMLGDVIACDVRCHDEDSVFTFDGLPLTVCEATLRATAGRTEGSIPANVLSNRNFIKV